MNKHLIYISQDNFSLYISQQLNENGFIISLYEYLIIEIRYDKTYDTFIWTMFYEDGYAIFKTKKYEQTFNLHFPI